MTCVDPIQVDGSQQVHNYIWSGAWPNHTCTEASKYICNVLINRPVVYITLIFHATNWQNLCHNYIQKFTSCMFHNKLLLVCPLHEHSTCHRLGCPAAVGFHTDLQLYCRIHKGMEVYAFHVPHNLLSKITTVMI